MPLTVPFAFTDIGSILAYVLMSQKSETEMYITDFLKRGGDSEIEQKVEEKCQKFAENQATINKIDPPENENISPNIPTNNDSSKNLPLIPSQNITAENMAKILSPEYEPGAAQICAQVVAKNPGLSRSLEKEVENPGTSMEMFGVEKLDNNAENYEKNMETWETNNEKCDKNMEKWEKNKCDRNVDNVCDRNVENLCDKRKDCETCGEEFCREYLWGNHNGANNREGGLLWEFLLNKEGGTWSTEIDAGGVVAKVGVYCREHFWILRRMAGIDEQAFIESVSSSRDHAPLGGKSGAQFHRTEDEKYLIKQMNRYEVSMLNSRSHTLFAHYAQVFNGGGPSCLTPIFAAFHLNLSIPHKNILLNEKYILMPNLQISLLSNFLQFDLKGVGTRRYISFPALLGDGRIKGLGKELPKTEKLDVIKDVEKIESKNEEKIEGKKLITDGLPFYGSNGLDAKIGEMNEGKKMKNGHDAPKFATNQAKKNLKSYGSMLESDIIQQSGVRTEKDGGEIENFASEGLEGKNNKKQADNVMKKIEENKKQIDENIDKKMLIYMENINDNMNNTHENKSDKNDENLIAKFYNNHNIVLWDQNFREYTQGLSLLLEDHNQLNHLLTAVNNDTSLLVDLEVVDYSMLLLIDEANGEIRLGLIDFLRPYTWDKQVETVGKTFFYFGFEQPTVVSPSVYSQRFSGALKSFFSCLYPSAVDFAREWELYIGLWEISEAPNGQSEQKKQTVRRKRHNNPAQEYTTKLPNTHSEIHTTYRNTFRNLYAQIFKHYHAKIWAQIAHLKWYLLIPTTHYPHIRHSYEKIYRDMLRHSRTDNLIQYAKLEKFALRKLAHLGEKFSNNRSESKNKEQISACQNQPEGYITDLPNTRQKDRLFQCMYSYIREFIHRNIRTYISNHFPTRAEFSTLPRPPWKGRELNFFLSQKKSCAKKKIRQITTPYCPNNARKHLLTKKSLDAPRGNLEKIQTKLSAKNPKRNHGLKFDCSKKHLRKIICHYSNRQHTDNNTALSLTPVSYVQQILNKQKVPLENIYQNFKSEFIKKINKGELCVDPNLLRSIAYQQFQKERI